MVRDPFVENWLYNWVKGVIQKYTARGTRRTSTVARTVKTALTKGFISAESLSVILSDVERESVAAFTAGPSYLETKQWLIGRE